MKKNKVEISKINIKIGDKEIPLTLEEAQELRQILDDTFGQKMVVYPSTPIYIERPRPWRYWEPTITWTTTTSGISSKAATYTLTAGGANSTFNSADTLPSPVN